MSTTTVQTTQVCTWEIEAQEGGVTRLTVVHDGLECAPKTAESVAGGWMLVLSGLKALLERGAPLAGRAGKSRGRARCARPHRCARHDSNMRPLPPQGSALSPELRALGTVSVARC